MEEIWKPVVGYEGFYEISNLGNLMRVSTHGGKSCRKPRAYALKKGYRSYHLCANGVRKYRLAHLMVWKAFKGPIPKGMEINHEDGDRNNPALSNLEPMTSSKNKLHSYHVLGRTQYNCIPKRGVENGSARLTEKDVIRVRELHARGWRRIDIAAEFGVADTNIGHIISGKSWRHLLPPD